LDALVAQTFQSGTVQVKVDTEGIGYLVSQASSLQQIPNLMVGIFIYAILGISADVVVRVIERVAMPWRRHLAVR
jgi:sulfonate transport system permease protein